MRMRQFWRKYHIGNKLCSCMLIGILVLSSFASFSMAGNGDDENDNTDTEKVKQLQESINEKQGQLTGLNSEKQTLINGKTNIQNLKNSLVYNKQQMSEVVETLDMEVTKLQTNIDNYTQLIDDKKAEILVTQEEVAAAKAEVDTYYEAMKSRIRSMYESGNMESLELILTSSSLSEMLNRADYIDAVEAYDKQQLEEYKLVVEYAELVEEELEQQQAVLEEAQIALEEEQNNINELIDTKVAEIEALNEEINTTQAAINEYNEEIEAQNQMIEALEAAIAADRAALTEATRRHYDGGKFTHPCPGYVRVSSEFGTRKHPISGVVKLHNGIDLAAPSGTPIFAAYDGTVVAASYTSAMGNYIMIDHGDDLYTIYMHCVALYVNKGDAVGAGQKIAGVGTTGSSTGNHLHFTVRYKGQYENPRNYFTP